MQTSTQGERIKKIRQQLKLSQSELGKVLGIQKQFISQIERNIVLLNNEKLVMLLQKYNININYVLAGIGDIFIKLYQISEDSELESKIQQVVLKMKENGII